MSSFIDSFNVINAYRGAGLGIHCDKNVALENSRQSSMGRGHGMGMDVTWSGHGALEWGAGHGLMPLKEASKGCGYEKQEAEEGLFKNFARGQHCH